jgi:hypothetical protein
MVKNGPAQHEHNERDREAAKQREEYTQRSAAAGNVAAV